MKKPFNIIPILCFILIGVLFFVTLALGAQTLLSPSNIATSSGSAGQVLMISDGKFIVAATSSANSVTITTPPPLGGGGTGSIFTLTCTNCGNLGQTWEINTNGLLSPTTTIPMITSSTTIQGYLNTGIINASSSVTTQNLTVNGTCTGCGTASASNPDIVLTNIAGTKYDQASSTANPFSFPKALVSNGSTTITALNSNTISIATSSAVAQLSIQGHISVGATGTPIVTACGTSPVVVGSDVAGKVTIGAGVISSCTISFTTSWTNAPHCFADDETAILLVRTVATQSTLTLSTAATFPGDSIDYFCISHYE